MKQMVAVLYVVLSGIAKAAPLIGSVEWVEQAPLNSGEFVTHWHWGFAQEQNWRFDSSAVAIEYRAAAPDDSVWLGNIARGKEISAVASRADVADHGVKSDGPGLFYRQRKSGDTLKLIIAALRGLELEGRLHPRLLSGIFAHTSHGIYGGAYAVNGSRSPYREAYDVTYGGDSSDADADVSTPVILGLFGSALVCLAGIGRTRRLSR